MEDEGVESCFRWLRKEMRHNARGGQGLIEDYYPRDNEMGTCSVIGGRQRCCFRVGKALVQCSYGARIRW